MSVVAFRREANDETPSAKCFGFVQTYDEKPRRRLWEVLKSQGMQENQQLVFLSDGGDSVRQLQEYVHPDGEHLIDWFHITMRLTVLQQQTKTLQAEQPEVGEKVGKQLDSVKHLLWHGNPKEALEGLTGLILDLDLLRAASPAAAKLGQSLGEFETYIRNNVEFIPNFGERYRQGETISTAFVESTIKPGSQQALRQEAADALDAARCALAAAEPHQGFELRSGGGFLSVVSGLPPPSRLTPNFLTLSSPHGGGMQAEFDSNGADLPVLGMKQMADVSNLFLRNHASLRKGSIQRPRRPQIWQTTSPPRVRSSRAEASAEGPVPGGARAPAAWSGWHKAKGEGKIYPSRGRAGAGGSRAGGRDDPHARRGFVDGGAADGGIFHGNEDCNNAGRDHSGGRDKRRRHRENNDKPAGEKEQGTGTGSEAGLDNRRRSWQDASR